MTPYVPGAEEVKLQEVVRVALAVRTTTGQATERPVLAPVRLTPPAKLKVLVRMTPTDAPVCPRLRFAPLTVIMKSPTWIVTSTEWEIPDVLPAMLTSYAPGFVALREQVLPRVTFAVRLTGVTGQDTVRPDAEEVPVTVTGPAKLKRLVRVTPAVTPVLPKLKSTAVTVRVKSPT